MTGDHHVKVVVASPSITIFDWPSPSQSRNDELTSPLRPEPGAFSVLWEPLRADPAVCLAALGEGCRALRPQRGNLSVRRSVHEEIVLETGTGHLLRLR